MIRIFRMCNYSHEIFEFRNLMDNNIFRENHKSVPLPCVLQKFVLRSVKIYKVLY